MGNTVEIYGNTSRFARRDRLREIPIAISTSEGGFISMVFQSHFNCFSTLFQLFFNLIIRILVLRPEKESFAFFIDSPAFSCSM